MVIGAHGNQRTSVHIGNLDIPGELELDEFKEKQYGEVRDIPLCDLDYEDTTLEFRIDRKIKDLADSIREVGQQIPVIVRNVPGSDKYQIISGFRRCRALRSIGHTHAIAIVREDLDDDAAYRLSFLENRLRRKLSTMDIANAISKLKLTGKSDAEVGRIFGLKERQVRNYRAFTQFPARLRQEIDAGNSVTVTHGLTLMTIIRRNDPHFDLEEWIRKINASPLSVAQLRRKLNRVFGKPNKKRRFEVTDDGGFRIYPMRFSPGITKDEDRDDILFALERAIQLVKK